MLSPVLARLGLSLAALLAAAGLGYVVGRGQGGLDERTAAELARYRTDAPQIEAERDSLRGVVREADARLDSARAVSLVWRDRAREAERRADARRSEADGVRLLLAGAASCADSLGLVLTEAHLRAGECAALRVALAAADSATAADAVSRDALGQIVTAQRARIAADSGERRVMASLIDRLERRARGCRVPLLGWPCPTGTVALDARDRTVHAGVGLPVTRWLTVGVQWRVVE